MSKYTKWPWITEQNHDILWIGSGKNHGTKVDEIVLHINYDPEYKDEVKEKIRANARLISCAPEMLEALQTVIEEDWLGDSPLSRYIQSLILKATQI